MNVTVVGSGYVGLVLAAGLAELGHNVTCIDKDAEKIARLRRGRVPIFERHLEDLVTRNDRRLHFSKNNLRSAVRQSDAIFIAVGTPILPGGRCDLSYVDEAIDAIIDAIKDALDNVAFQHKLVIEKSTVPVGTGERIARRLPKRVDVVSNPEFLREGSAVTDFLYPDRIVVGTTSPKSLAMMRELYQPLLDGSYALRNDAIPCPEGGTSPTRMIATTVESAEIIKHAANAFLAMKISFINAVSAVCERAGADIEDVARGIGTDTRIGTRFLRAGIGYGGSCFPKDLAAFRAVAEELGIDFDLLAEVERINVDQRQRFLEKVRTALGGRLRGRRIAALGISFKPGTDDVRESPALDIVRALVEEGCQVSVYDPVAIETARKEMIGIEARVRFANSPYAAAKNVDATVILTDWNEFAMMDLERLRGAMREPVLVDGRNLFSPDAMAELGFTYISVGRPAVTTLRRATGMAG
jgi:UDPglucose 6-dehydrogenase